MENNELYHFGIKGMKWGVRRYQNEDGSLTDEGRRHYGYSIRRAGSAMIKAIKTKHDAKVDLKKKAKAKKQKQKQLEAARKAKAEKKAHEEGKKKALERGSAQDVMKYKDELTQQERNDAFNRLNSEANLARLASEERRREAEERAANSKWNKFRAITNKAGDLSDSIEKSAKLYNSFAKVYNTYADTPLPVIGEKKNQDSTSMRMSKKFIEQYKTMSTNYFLNMSDDDYKKLKDSNDRLSELQKLEKLSKGEGGKKKK